MLPTWAGTGLFLRLAAEAEADPGREVCGFVVEGWGAVPGGAEPGPGPEPEVVPVRNVAGEAEGPGGTCADPRRAYRVDPAAHLALARRLRREGRRILAVYHSHVEGPARLSPADREEAVVDGRPSLPGAAQLVIGMNGGKVSEIGMFEWSEGGYREAGRLRPPGRRPPALRHA